VLGVGVVLNGGLFIIGILTRNMHDASGEILPTHDDKLRK
jgi:hypothetical protein